jgi:hypothetical protein
MNLARHAAVLWRFRAVTATGLILGLLLAVLASYQVPSMERRGISTFTSESQILVTQRGFPEGRVVLPQAPPPSSGSATGVASTSPTDKTSSKDENAPEFADPGRFINLADLYTQLITSDEVLSRIPEHPAAAQITAMPLPANSGSILPIISISTVGPTSEAAHQLNVHTIEALKKLLADEARKNDIAPGELVELTMLKAPSPGALLTGPSHTGSILALLLAVIGTVAVTHLLESLRNRREPEPTDEAEPWTLGESHNGNGSAHAADDELAALAAGDWATPTARSRRE